MLHKNSLLILSFFTGFCCRAKEECHDILNGHLLYGKKDENGVPEYIQLSETITKTRRGKANDKRDIDGRIYADNENPGLCNVRTILAYQDRKTPAQRNSIYPFLLSVKSSAQNHIKEPYWYTNNRMGINTIGKLFPDALSSAGIDVRSKKKSQPQFYEKILFKLVPNLQFQEVSCQKLPARNIWIPSCTTWPTRIRRTKLPASSSPGR